MQVILTFTNEENVAQPMIKQFSETPHTALHAKAQSLKEVFLFAFLILYFCLCAYISHLCSSIKFAYRIVIDRYWFFITDTDYLYVYVPDNRYAEPIFIYCYKVNK